MDKKEIAHARREDRRIRGEVDLNATNNANAISDLTNQVNNTVNGINQNINSVTNVSNAAYTEITNQMDLTNVNSWEIRIQNLENAPPSGGGGGIDPSDPTAPIILWDNFLSQSNGNESGTLSPYSTFGGGVPTSSELLTPTGIYIFEDSSVAGHLGVVNLHLPSQFLPGTNGFLSLVYSATVDSFTFADFNTLYFIIKTPAAALTDTHFLKIGLFDNVSTPTGNGIYFHGTRGANWVPTCYDGTTSTGTTTVYADETWYTLKIDKKSATSVGFTINGGTEYVVTTDVPTGFLSCGLYWENTTAFPAENLDMKLDFVGIRLGEMPVSLGSATVLGTTNEVEVNLVGTDYVVGLPNNVTVVELNTDQINFDTTVTAPTLAAGEMSWDVDHGTAILQLNGVHNALGTNVHQRVHNNSGVTIAKGDIVYVSGSQGTDRLRVAQAQANAEATSSPTVGLAAEAIAHGADGFVTTYGLLQGLTTNTYTAGDAIFLSETTAGGWRTGHPAAPNHGTHVGWIVKSAGAGAGSIFVKVHNFNEITELSDVYIPSTPANLDVLSYDNADARWENKTLAAAGIAAASHTHPLSDLTNSGAVDGQVATWNSLASEWIPDTPTVLVPFTPQRVFYETNQTGLTIPIGATLLFIHTHGGGGGGGGGSCNTAGNNRCGGGAGGGGGVFRGYFQTANLTSGTINVTIGAGGAGGNGSLTAAVSPTVGSGGGITSVICTYNGVASTRITYGAGGIGGSVVATGSPANGGAGASQGYNGGTGGAGSATGAGGIGGQTSGSTGLAFPGYGGGGGGGVNTSNTASAGGATFGMYPFNDSNAVGGTAGGGNGVNAVDSRGTIHDWGRPAGTGGGGNSAGVGGLGGSGIRGSGGGGGGGSTGATAPSPSGKGGAGGNGYVIFYWF